MEDTDEDGLDFWANNDGGGMVRFREIGASWLKAFNADFGTNIIHQFTIGESQSTTQHNNQWEIFPNPTNNNIVIEGVCNEKSKITILDNLGKEIISPIITSSGFISETIDLSKFENGIYFVKINNDQENKITKVIKQ